MYFVPFHIILILAPITKRNTCRNQNYWSDIINSVILNLYANSIS